MSEVVISSIPSESWPEPSETIAQKDVCPGCWESLMVCNRQVARTQKNTPHGVCFGFHGEA